MKKLFTFLDGYSFWNGMSFTRPIDVYEEEENQMFDVATENRIARAMIMIETELRSALEKHPNGFNSSHEGYAVILEEVDELWDEVKMNNKPAQLLEATQVGAMAARYLVNLGG